MSFKHLNLNNIKKLIIWQYLIPKFQIAFAVANLVLNLNTFLHRSQTFRLIIPMIGTKVSSRLNVVDFGHKNGHCDFKNFPTYVLQIQSRETKALTLLLQT